MKIRVLFSLPVLVGILFLSPAQGADNGAGKPADPSLAVRDELTSTLMFMKGIYQTGYAPAAWKKSYAQWDLDTEIGKALDAAQKTPNLDVPAARQILRGFIYSMKDYHVSISFNATESSTLPFSVRSVGDKVFIAWVDSGKVSALNVGDELVTFGGQPAAQAIAGVQAETPANIPATDHALAEIVLTRRSAAKGYRIPKGPIVIGVRSPGSSTVQNIEMTWDHVGENIKPNPFLGATADLNQSLKRQIPAAPAGQPFQFKSPRMTVDAAMITGPNPYLIGSRKAFTPDLSQEKIMETDEDNPFYAYYYREEDGKSIGYIRIPSYEPEDTDKAIAAFAKVIQTFERGTDALIIDQVNNPGGSIFYMYTLLSMLSSQPLKTPQHEMALNQQEIQDSVTDLAMASKVTDTASAKKVIGDTLDGYPVDYEVAQFLFNSFRFKIGEWNAGKVLTQPSWIAGVDQINPSSVVTYTKPILLITNALDFSGGDFFPATLQDNGRVTIFGSRTAGAGGYVRDISFPNTLGINAFRITNSIAHRVTTNPIENLGVKPDIEYTFTEKDMTDGYADYAQAIQKAVESLK